MKPTKTARILACLAACLSLVHAAGAQSPATDVAVITGLSGEAQYESRSDEERTPLNAFQQVAADSILTLATGSTVTLVYFTGRKESWEGPAVLRLTAEGGEAVDAADTRAQPSNVTDEVPTQIETLPHVAGTARAAVTVVMAPAPFDPPPAGDCRHWRSLALTEAERDAIERAGQLFERMRAQAAPGDFTPEAYWLSVLGQYDQFDRMTPVLDRLDAQLPGNPTIARLRWRIDNCAPVLQ